MATINPGCDMLESVVQNESTPKRRKKSGAVLPKYINRIDGRGWYLRFAFTAKDIQSVSDLVESLYKANLIDYSYVHVYSKLSVESGLPARVVAHGIAHVVSRDYDFQFWRAKLPKVSFKISTYPDNSYPKQNETTEVLQTGVIQNNPDFGINDGGIDNINFV